MKLRALTLWLPERPGYLVVKIDRMGRPRLAGRLASRRAAEVLPTLEPLAVARREPRGKRQRRQAAEEGFEAFRAELL